MKEFIELRINQEYADYLFKSNEERKLGNIVSVVKIPTSDPRYNRIYEVNQYISKMYDTFFYSYWEFIRIYSKEEVHAAHLFQLSIKKAFEPIGEDFGTVYDYTSACPLCLGAYGRKQSGSLKLPKGKIPRKDISRTIAGEYVVSKRFAEIVEKWGIRGIVLGPIESGKRTIEDFFQLFADKEISLSDKTIAQDNPWTTKDVVEESTYYTQGYKEVFKKEYHRCTTGHLIGLNLISEVFVNNDPILKEYDYIWSRQRIGVKRGVLYPEPVHLCSPRFRQMVIEEKLTGFDFEVAYIDKE